MIEKPSETRSLTSYVPEVDEFLEMDAKDLGPLLLKLASQSLQQGMFQPKDIADWTGLPLEPARDPMPPKYPVEHQEEVTQALAEAWNWLWLNGFIMPAFGTNGTNGWKVLTKAGVKALEKHAKGPEKKEPVAPLRRPVAPPATSVK